MSLLSQDDLAYLREAAARDKYNADDAARLFSYESSNRSDVWGGKGNRYFGLFQAGPEERAQFGIDTEHPSARNQIDAFGKFLNARGYKPTMGLLDMYSTVNAGSPGHYSASDRPGMTVAKHVEAMGGASPPPAPPIPGFVGSPLEDPAYNSAYNSLDAMAADEATPSPSMPAGLGLLAGLMQEPQNSQLPQNPQLPTPKRMAVPQTSGRGLALRQLTVKSPKFSLISAAHN
jgi:hypothetical protein